MKKLMEKLWGNTAVFLLGNVVIGIATLITISGFIVGGIYIFEVAGQLYGQMLPVTLRIVISIAIIGAIALTFLAIFGNWVREKIIDEFQMFRWRREQARLSESRKVT